MSRIRQADSSALPDDLQGLYRAFADDKSNFTNQLNSMAHSPEAFRHLYGLLDAWRGGSLLPARLLEIAVVTVSRVNECPYCVAHHGTRLVDMGLGAVTVTAILDPAPPGFDDRDLVVRDYARLVTERAWGIRDDVFTRLRRHFNDGQIVELTVRIGLCGLFNKFNQALQIELEDSIGDDVARMGLGAAIGDDPNDQTPDGAR